MPLDDTTRDENLAPGTSGPSSGRKRVVKTARLSWWRAPAEQRQALLEDCYAIYCEQSRTLARDELAARFFGHPSTRVGLFYGADGELAGFSNAALSIVDIAGREHGVFSAGVYIRLAYRGGDASVLFGLSEALRQKALAPRRPLSYMAMASSPAPYHLYASSVPRLWPAPGVDTPADVEQAIRTVARARGLEPSGGDPWLVRTYVKPEDPERIRRSSRLRDQASVAFYEARNPTWADPERATALLVWIPLDARNLLGGLRRVMARRLARAKR